MDTGERAGDDGKTTEVAGLESGVLTGRTLTVRSQYDAINQMGSFLPVVPVTNDNPGDVLGLVVTSDGGDGIPLAGGEVLDLVGLTVGLVRGANQHVVAVTMSVPKHDSWQIWGKAMT